MALNINGSQLKVAVPGKQKARERLKGERKKKKEIKICVCEQ